MTTPAASVLGKVRAVVEGARYRRTLDEQGIGQETHAREMNRASLAALPVATDEGAVEELAKWVRDKQREAIRGSGKCHVPVTFEQARYMARAVLTELLAGGAGSG